MLQGWGFGDAGLVKRTKPLCNSPSVWPNNALSHELLVMLLLPPLRRRCWHCPSRPPPLHLHVAMQWPLTYATASFCRHAMAPGTFVTPTDSLCISHGHSTAMFHVTAADTGCAWCCCACMGAQGKLLMMSAMLTLATAAVAPLCLLWRCAASPCCSDVATPRAVSYSRSSDNICSFARVGVIHVRFAASVVSVNGAQGVRSSSPTYRHQVWTTTAAVFLAQ